MIRWESVSLVINGVKYDGYRAYDEGCAQFVPTKALPPPCTCVTLESGVILADGCAMHDARGAKSTVERYCEALGEALAEGIAGGIR